MSDLEELNRLNKSRSGSFHVCRPEVKKNKIGKKGRIQPEDNGKSSDGGDDKMMMIMMMIRGGGPGWFMCFMCFVCLILSICSTISIIGIIEQIKNKRTLHVHHHYNHHIYHYHHPSSSRRLARGCLDSLLFSYVSILAGKKKATKMTTPRPCFVQLFQHANSQGGRLQRSSQDHKLEEILQEDCWSTIDMIANIAEKKKKEEKTKQALDD